MSPQERHRYAEDASVVHKYALHEKWAHHISHVFS